MARTLSAWLVLGLVAATAGCSMCAHNYDYCGPVYTRGCNGYACNGPRAGSIRAMGETILAPHPALPPDAIGSAATGSANRSVVYQPNSPLDQIVSPLQTPIAPSRQVAQQGPMNVRQYLPAGDRGSAQILSVTDESLAEAQARRANTVPVASQPASSGAWTARRPSGTAR